jgi:hypothetical protein
MGRLGFTLVEMLIATTMALLVMIAAMNISSMMVRTHLQSVHRGQLSGLVLASLDGMQRDMAGASFISISSPGPSSGDAVAGCANWSSVAGGAATAGRLDPSQNVEYFIYCVTAPRFGAVYRWKGTLTAPPFCDPAPAVPSCGNVADNKGNMPELLVGGDGVNTGMSYGDAGLNYFSRSRSASGIELHYIVGNSTPTADAASRPGQYAPQFYKVDTRVNTITSFNNPSD